MAAVLLPPVGQLPPSEGERRLAAARARAHVDVRLEQQPDERHLVRTLMNR